MDDLEFDNQMALLRTKGLEALKKKGPFIIINPATGEEIKVDYDSTKEMLDEMKEIVAEARRLKFRNKIK